MDTQTLNFNKVHFVTSAPDIRHLPNDGGVEIAFAGRSNAGKSSALNTLTKHKNLARTSKTPGRTQLINLFELEPGKRLVDLPGYGYARRSKVPETTNFEALTQAYFGRDEATGLLLIDTRHPGLENDRAAWQWLRAAAPAALVGTKIDKLPRGQRIRALRQLESVFEDTVLPVSAVTGEGLDELWKLIDRLANSRQP